MKKNLFVNFCERTIAIIFFIIAAFLLVLSIYNTSAISVSYDEYTYFIKDNYIRNIFIILLFIIALFVLSKLKITKSLIKRINNDNKLFAKLKYISFGVVFLLTIYWIITAWFWPEADQWSVQQIVVEMRNGDFSSFVGSGYLARYPFQSGIVLLSYLFSFVFGAQNFIALEIFNAIMVILFYKVLCDIVKELGASNFEQLLIILSAIFFPILLFYCYFIYGTIPGLTMCAFSFKYFIVFNKKEKTKDLILCIIFTIFALLFKTNYLIYLIAIVISAIIKLIEKRNIKTLMLVFALCLTYLFQSFVPVKIMESISDTKLNNGMSNLSWIAMGLQEGERAPGWYNGYNNDSFAASNNNSSKQKEIALEEISNRLDAFKDKEYAFEFFTKKATSQWNNPTFQVFWNLDGKIYKEETRSSWAMFFVEKLGQYQFQKYLNIIQTLVLFGVLVYSMNSINNKLSIEHIFFGLFLIGGFLFQLFWEGKAQYTFVYFVPLIPYAISGYKKLLSIKKLEIKPQVIIELVIVISMMLTFQLGIFSFLDIDNKNYYNYIYDIEEY